MFRFLSWALCLVLISVILHHFKKRIPDASEKWTPLLLCLGIGGALWLAHYRFSLWYLEPWPALASDFVQYCDAILASEKDLSPRFTQRSPIVAQLVSWGTIHLGIVDGLVISNMLAFVILCLGIALWSSLAGNRFSALLSVPLVLSFAPMTLMSRMLDFYPIYAAVWTLSSGLSALSLKKMNPIWAAVGASLALLVDPRGLLWALCALAIALGVVIKKGRWFHVFLFLPLIFSYGLAHQLIPENAPSLELQAWWFAQERAGIFDPKPIPLSHTPFVWGHSPILHIPQTLWTLMTLSSPELLPAHQTGLAQERMVYVFPKLFLLVGLGLMVSWFQKTRPSTQSLLILFLPALPFVLALWQLSTSQIAIRRLLLAWPFAVVLLGYGLSQLWMDYRHKAWVPMVVLFLAVWTLNWGRFDPQWFYPMQEPPDVDTLYAVHPEHKLPTDPTFRDAHCEAALKEDLEDGHLWGGRFRMNWPIKP